MCGKPGLTALWFWATVVLPSVSWYDDTVQIVEATAAFTQCGKSPKAKRLKYTALLKFLSAFCPLLARVQLDVCLLKNGVATQEERERTVRVTGLSCIKLAHRFLFVAMVTAGWVFPMWAVRHLFWHVLYCVVPSVLLIHPQSFFFALLYLLTSFIFIFFFTFSPPLPHLFLLFSFLSSPQRTPGPIIWPRPPPSPCHYTRWLSCHSVPVATL